MTKYGKSRLLPIDATSNLGNRRNLKLVLFWEDLLRLFAIARVANLNNELNLATNPVYYKIVIYNSTED